VRKALVFPTAVCDLLQVVTARNKSVGACARTTDKALQAVLHDVAAALAALHAAGCSHNDLKADNVLLMPTDSPWEPRGSVQHLHVPPDPVSLWNTTASMTAQCKEAAAAFVDPDCTNYAGALRNAAVHVNRVMSSAAHDALRGVAMAFFGALVQGGTLEVAAAETFPPARRLAGVLHDAGMASISTGLQPPCYTLANVNAAYTCAPEGRHLHNTQASHRAFLEASVGAGAPHQGDAVHCDVGDMQQGEWDDGVHTAVPTAMPAVQGGAVDAVAETWTPLPKQAVDVWAYGLLVFVVYTGVNAFKETCDSDEQYCAFMGTLFGDAAQSLHPVSMQHSPRWHDWAPTRATKALRKLPPPIVQMLRACLQPQVHLRCSATDILRSPWWSVSLPSFVSSVNLEK